MSKRPAEESSRATWFGWKLFGPRDPDAKHACKICGQKIKYSNSTSTFKSHYESKHPEQWAEAKEKKEDIERVSALEEEGTARTAPSILDFLSPDKIQQKAEASRAFVKSMEKDLVTFLVGDVRPFSAVEGPSPFRPCS